MMKTYNDRYFEASEAMRYSVHCALGQEFDIIIFEYEDHYMVDIDYKAYQRPFKSYVYDELADLVTRLVYHDISGWDYNKPVLISSSNIILDHYIKDQRLKRVPRSLFYYLVK